MKKWYLYIIIIGVMSCSDERQEQYIDPEIRPYFNRFSEAAANRGLTIDIDEENIEGYIHDLAHNNLKGQCVHDKANPKKVVINQSFWQVSDDHSKEFIVFHELGHCILNRSHQDDLDPIGMCKSIMHSGSQACRENYNAATREEYLDELFDF